MKKYFTIPLFSCTQALLLASPVLAETWITQPERVTCDWGPMPEWIVTVGNVLKRGPIYGEAMVVFGVDFAGRAVDIRVETATAQRLEKISTRLIRNAKFKPACIEGMTGTMPGFSVRLRFEGQDVIYGDILKK